MTIAALYVDPRGPYLGLPDVDPWTVERDARGYDGPHPVVAHPPCERWGRYASGGPRADPLKPGAQARKVPGDDGGCFAAALWAVVRCGGVLEHPAGSKAWAAHDIPHPPRAGGWVGAGTIDTWTCCVEQGHYGHPARKPTWLLYVGPRPPELVWGPSYVDGGARPLEHMAKSERHLTPPAFRDLLLSLARGVR